MESVILRRKGAKKMALTDEAVNEILKGVRKNISTERKKRGLSMAKLAAMANLSVSHISKLESARCDIGLKALLRIAAALEMEAEDLLPHEIIQTGCAEQTAGERFENIMQGADPQTIEMFLTMALFIRRNKMRTFA